MVLVAADEAEDRPEPLEELAVARRHAVEGAPVILPARRRRHERKLVLLALHVAD